MAEKVLLTPILRRIVCWLRGHDLGDPHFRAGNGWTCRRCLKVVGDQR